MSNMSYDKVCEYSNGVAEVIKRKVNELGSFRLYGLIDEQGNVVIPCEYIDLRQYDNGLIKVENQEGYYAYLDRQWNEVVPFSRGYNFAGSYNNGRAIVGKYVDLRPIDDESSEINPSGIFIDSKSEATRSVLHSSNKYPRVFGFIDESGNEVVPLQYDDVKKFSEGLAAVKDSNGKWGFIDPDGREIIPFEYDEVYNSFEDVYEGFYNGTAIVKKDDKWGSINKDNVSVIPFEYDEVSPLIIADAVVVKQGNGWGAVDIEGKELVGFWYLDVDDKLERQIEKAMKTKCFRSELVK